ncbi:Uncharacterised protein [uncultured archaeon]|nr:Uncharacterised protein [uncultured archaeon]
MNSELPVVTPEPNPFWRENARKLVGESISTIEDVAKQLIAVNSLLEGIYFHAIAFSNVKPILTDGIAGIYLAPILLWLLSLVFAVLTLSPKAYAININSSRDSKERFEEIVVKKHGMLKWSEFFLILSFIALFAAVAHYLLTVPIKI